MPRSVRVVVLLLFVAGWATNHFAAMIPVLRETEGLSAQVLAGAFGVYALGLLPGLLFGGMISDRLGRRPVVLTGSVLAAAGNLLMLLWHPAAGVYAGRLVVGIGVGLAISGGTAWVGDLAGRKGTMAAGMILSAGFGVGPLVTGLVAQFVPTALVVTLPFTITISLSLFAVLLALRAAPSPVAVPVAVPGTTPIASPAPSRPEPVPAPDPDPERSVALALARSVPMAVWVFSTGTVAMVVLASRLGGGHNGPWAAGAAAALGLGTGVAVQEAARRAGWGPRAGIGGALLAALGFALSARVDAHPDLVSFVVATVVCGAAYGLCLRAGLVDVETFTPPAHRGATVGIYYVCTYLGFGLPVLLESLRPTVGTTWPLLLLAALAVGAAALRARQLAD